MAHLKCRDHDARVIVSPLSTLHRSDGTKCTSAVLLMDKQQTTPELVRKYARGDVSHFHAFNRPDHD
jgi:hypothetical protein